MHSQISTKLHASMSSCMHGSKSGRGTQVRAFLDDVEAGNIFRGGCFSEVFLPHILVPLREFGLVTSGHEDEEAFGVCVPSGPLNLAKHRHTSPLALCACMHMRRGHVRLSRVAMRDRNQNEVVTNYGCLNVVARVCLHVYLLQFRTLEARLVCTDF